MKKNIFILWWLSMELSWLNTSCNGQNSLGWFPCCPDVAVVWCQSREVSVCRTGWSHRSLPSCCLPSPRPSATQTAPRRRAESASCWSYPTASSPDQAETVTSLKHSYLLRNLILYKAIIVKSCKHCIHKSHSLQVYSQILSFVIVHKVFWPIEATISNYWAFKFSISNWCFAFWGIGDSITSKGDSAQQQRLLCTQCCE